MLFDLGYPALDFIALFVLAGKDVVMRTPDSRITEVHAAIHAASDDQIIHIPLQTARRRLSPTLLGTIRTLTRRGPLRSASSPLR